MKHCRRPSGTAGPGVAREAAELNVLGNIQPDELTGEIPQDCLKSIPK
jgi:hypothetical protein